MVVVIATTTHLLVAVAARRRHVACAAMAMAMAIVAIVVIVAIIAIIPAVTVVATAAIIAAVVAVAVVVVVAVPASVVTIRGVVSCRWGVLRPIYVCVTEDGSKQKQANVNKQQNTATYPADHVEPVTASAIVEFPGPGEPKACRRVQQLEILPQTVDQPKELLNMCGAHSKQKTNKTTRN